MASIESYKYDIRRYNSIKSNLQTIINYLNSYNVDCDDLSKQIKNVYSINSDDSNLYDNVISIKEDVYKTSNYLKNTVIPSINNEIYSLNKKIAKLQAEEAAGLE